MKKEEKCAIQENGTKKQSTEEQSPKEYSPVEESTLKRKLQYYSGEIQRDVGNLVKWLMIAVVVGCIVGAASNAVFFCVKRSDQLQEGKWMDVLFVADDGTDYCISV